MIIVGADNHPPMLEKYLTKEYEELSATEKIQDNCNCKATNIILQGLPPDVYAIVNHHKGETLYQYYWRFAQLINNMNVINMSMRPVQVNTKFLNSLPPEWSLVVPVFNQGDDLIVCLNKATAILTSVASLRGSKDRVMLSKRPRNAAWSKEKAMLVEAQEAGQILDEEQLAFLADPGILDGQVVQTTIPNNVAFQIEDLDAYDYDCDDVSNAKAVLMANLSSYGSDVLSEVPHSDSYHNDMDNQSVHAVHDFEQTPVVDFSNNEIHSDSNIILYS
ncbi:hypothetical protein Tco_0533176 [Tanacetum coccineum]